MNTLHVVFDGFPSPDGPRFVEVENPKGESVNAGEWRSRSDGLTELVIPHADADTHYAYGYSDGVSDALTAVRENPEATRALQRFCLKWIDCPDCNGTGNNLNPNSRDLATALLLSMGARSSSNPAACKTCHGHQIVAPKAGGGNG